MDGDVDVDVGADVDVHVGRGGSAVGGVLGENWRKEARVASCRDHSGPLPGGLRKGNFKARVGSERVPFST